mgnify:CR=1 FL=1
MEYFIQALHHMFAIDTMLILAIGVFVGVIVGALPGLGSAIGITLCIPFTFTMNNVAAIALIVGVYAGSTYGGCISAILINTPGTPQSAATCFDGFPMALKGKSEEAIGWATIGSVVGGTLSCFILIFCAPQLAAVAVKFGPIEMFALILMGMTCIVTVSGENVFKGLLSGAIGISLCMVGLDPMTGDVRFTFGNFTLSGGFDLIPVLVGIFALSEVLVRIDILTRQKLTNIISCKGMRFPSLKNALSRIKIMLHASVVGGFFGILPGVGAAPAVFFVYGEAKRISPNGDKFGTGEPDGILAPETTNNAVTGGALVPTLALGLPGDGATAVMLATLMLHGVTPGVRLMIDSPDIVYAIFLILFIANFMLIPMGILTSKWFSYMLRMPESLFLPMIVLICMLGAYGSRNSEFDLITALGAGLLGVFFRYLSIPAAPLVIGLVLGSQFEFALRQTFVLTRGDITELFNHPIAIGLILVVILLLLAPLRKNLRRKKAESV